MCVPENTLRQKINRFLYSPAYILAMALLTALSFVVGGEIVYYCLIALLAGYVCVSCEDLLPLTPIFTLVYVAPSVHSNPGRADNTIFSGSSLIFVVVIGLLILGCFTYRIIRDRKLYFRRGNKLMPGILILCAAYLLSGVGSAGYLSIVGKNLLFSLGQCAGLLLPYWLFANGVNWKKVRKDYLAWIGVAMGCLLFVEVLYIYVVNDVVSAGIIDREKIYAGWGMRNNIGCMMAMAIPFAFSLTFYYRKGFYGALGGGLFLLGVILTNSRTSVAFAVVAYVGCLVLMSLHANDRKKKLTVMLVAMAVIVLGVVIFHKKLFYMFQDVLFDTSELDHRFIIYRNGLKTFVKNPVFGGTFYPGKNMAWGWATSDVRSVLPDRWHNTVIQLLASTGVVGLVAYIIHRVQTVRLVMYFRSREKWLPVISLGIMLLCSLLDCHFFNVGPTLFYSTVLAFIEKQE